MKIYNHIQQAACFIAALLTAGAASAAINLVTFDMAIAGQGNASIQMSSDNGTTWQAFTFADPALSGDNQWGAWGGFCYGPDGDPATHDGRGFEVNYNENVPLVRITIGGLTAGTNYNLHGLFFSAGAYYVSMGGASDALVTGGANSADANLTDMTQQQRDDFFVGWNGEDAVGDNTNLKVYSQNFATQVADASGNLYYYIKDTTSTGLWLGVGYDVVPEPATYALILGGLALGFVMLRRRFKG